MSVNLTRILALRCMVTLSLCLFAMANKASAASIVLEDLGSTSGYRWLDIADQLYGATYRANYNYNDNDPQVIVTVTFESVDTTLHGTLEATNLKPNFAYQLKVVGFPGTPSNERIGFAGRWWQEEWNGSEWTNGQNLNNKGDGSSPNPNDSVYLSRRDTADPTSPTGLKYRYTGYLVFDYFITDEAGNALFRFEANSSYHVLWKTSQRARTADDRPVKSSSFDADPSSEAYDDDYPPQTVSLYGEWERLPVGGVFLKPGDYLAQIILTEESFHGNGEFEGTWAGAMGAEDLEFRIVTPCKADGDNNRNVDGSDLALFAADFGRTNCSGGCPGDFDRDRDVDESDLALFALDFGRNDCPEPLPPAPCNQFTIGDSIGEGEAADNTIEEAHHEVVWSTGYDPSDMVDSLNKRFEDADIWDDYYENNADRDIIFNHAVSGAVMADFFTQASEVVSAASTTPSGKAGMVTILLGSNDVCAPSLDDMTAPALFEAQYRAGLDVLAASDVTRHGYIHVSSIPAIYWLWNAKRDRLLCRLAWFFVPCENLLDHPADDCESEASRLDPDTDYPGDGENCKRRKDFHREIRMTYNRILRNVLQEYIDDGSLPNAYFVDIFDVKFEDIHINNGDCFHPSVDGHQLLVEEQWCRWPWNPDDPLCMP